jgi:hypothetical protein
LKGDLYDKHIDFIHFTPPARWASDAGNGRRRRRAGADHDSRPRAIRGKCVEDPERRLVPVMIGLAVFTIMTTSAGGTPIGADAAASEAWAEKGMKSVPRKPIPYPLEQVFWGLTGN